MKFMGWSPVDLGYRAVTRAHYIAAMELMVEQAKAANPSKSTDFFGEEIDELPEE